jgi:hypothetical protein
MRIRNREFEFSLNSHLAPVQVHVVKNSLKVDVEAGKDF